MRALNASDGSSRVELELPLHAQKSVFPGRALNGFALLSPANMSSFRVARK